MTKRRRAEVAEFLEDAYRRFHRPEFLHTDPLDIVHKYSRPEDQEVIGLIAAAFASGNIKSIQTVLAGIGGVLGRQPARWLADRQPAQLRGAFDGIYHRWVREEDIEVLMALIGEALRRYGTLGQLWRNMDDPREETTLPALARFCETITKLPVEPLSIRTRSMERDGRTIGLSPVQSILLTSPKRGSACKRMNLFLRWMIRPADGIDTGLWTASVSPARLVMPVDTHVLRICTGLGLTRRKAADARAAEEITEGLRRINPEDPCKYDFALVRAGIVHTEPPG